MATSGYVRGQFETDQPGNETTAATNSTKNIYAPAISFEPDLGVSHLERDDEIRDVDEPISVLTERYSPAWSMSARMYPDLVGFMLTAMLGQPTTTAGDAIITDPDSVAVPVGAHRHVWTAPFGPTGAFPYSAEWQVAYEDQSTYFDIHGAGVSAMSLETPEEGGALLNASGPALYIPKPVADPSLVESYESLTIPPFLHSHLAMSSWLAGSATAETVSLSIENPMEARHTMATGSKYPDRLYKADGPIVFSGSVPMELLDKDDVDALMDATGFSATLRWTSTAIIASSYPYKLYVEMSNAQYVAGGPSALENRRRIGASFDFRATYGGSTSVTVTLVNATADYT